MQAYQECKCLGVKAPMLLPLLLHMVTKLPKAKEAYVVMSQAPKYALPPNCDVDEFKDLNITLPESCSATTPMQLAVTLSHLKVHAVMACICHRCLRHSELTIGNSIRFEDLPICALSLK
jgi:hypothetical protein